MPARGVTAVAGGDASTWREPVAGGNASTWREPVAGGNASTWREPVAGDGDLVTGRSLTRPAGRVAGAAR